MPKSAPGLQINLLNVLYNLELTVAPKCLLSASHPPPRGRHTHFGIKRGVFYFHQSYQYFSIISQGKLLRFDSWMRWVLLQPSAGHQHQSRMRNYSTLEAHLCHAGDSSSTSRGGCLRDDRAGWGGEILQSRLLVNLTPLFLFNGLFGQQGAVLTSRFSSAWPYQSWPFLLCPTCLPFSYILWNLVLSSGARSSPFPCCRKRSSTFRFES